ncbi:hypothetical protein MUG87_08945 [Ectobacillus sp. JY-23]|uniref:hypothetical protein n=1 Tax=Ectobacillus sp. JY-23 TaxID=2933872 RepID=UPI001FF6BDED|nr:hypothetical protein [Ectobacillus sp. JY-23]UOY94200.1 hypothetical protein MUG87_08945 [Ectobacillus sp. JY-23]
MGIESYNFMLFVSGNTCNLTEIGWETVGSAFIPFSKVRDTLLNIRNINYTNGQGHNTYGCYFEYCDNTSIIEFELNGGEYEKLIQEISVRFAVCNSKSNFAQAMQIFKHLSIKLNLNTLDMRAGEVIDVTDDASIKRSYNSYTQKREEFFEFMKVPERKFERPLHCGSEVFTYVRRL